MGTAIFLLSAAGLFLVIMGLVEHFKDIEVKWDQHCETMAGRGLKPDRTPEWERSERASGIIIIILGVFALCFAGAMWRSVYEQSQALTNVTINGRRLKQGELDAIRSR